MRKKLQRSSFNENNTTIDIIKPATGAYNKIINIMFFLEKKCPHVE